MLPLLGPDYLRLELESARHRDERARRALVVREARKERERDRRVESASATDWR
jgi:hypothetical protein